MAVFRFPFNVKNSSVNKYFFEFESNKVYLKLKVEQIIFTLLKYNFYNHMNCIGRKRSPVFKRIKFICMTQVRNLLTFHKFVSF